MNKSKQSSIAHYYCHLFRVNCKEHCFILNYEFLKSYLTYTQTHFFLFQVKHRRFGRLIWQPKKRKHTQTHISMPACHLTSKTYGGQGFANEIKLKSVKPKQPQTLECTLQFTLLFIKQPYYLWSLSLHKSSIGQDLGSWVY